MLINADQPEQCRAVVLEDGKVENFISEHAANEQIKGNIYVGVINRVEPAIEAAFVDFGGKKFGFLPFKDVLKESYLQTGEKKARVRIQDVLVRGQKILVQVVKEGRDHKGPSLSNSISIPGRFLVLMFGSEGSGISRKIEDEDERKKLRSIVEGFNLPENMGVIIRTAGVGRTKLELQKDLQMLMKIWGNLQETMTSENKTPPFLLYQEADMVQRTVRDHFTADTDEIIVDNKEAYKAVRGFVKLILSRMQSKVKLYQDTLPLFSAFGVEEQIESIYQRSVNLPSGGSIVIDVGEAMVSIDVNSGKTTNSSELEATALKTNLEAADEVGRQLRLRDLGGLIVIDFIDMFQKKNKILVEKQVKKAFKEDKARINLARISKFGLLEMSRQRMSPPVKEGIFEKCRICEGTGHVRAVGAMAVHVLRKIQEMIASGVVKELSVEVHADVVSYLLNNKMEFIRNLQVDNKVKVNFSGKSHLEFSDFQYRVIERYKNDDSEIVPKGKFKTPKLVEETVRPKQVEKVARQKPVHEAVAKKQIAEAPPQRQKKVVPVRTDAVEPAKAVESEIENIPTVEGEDLNNKAEKGRSSRNRFQRRPQRRPRQVHGRRRRYSRRYDLYAKLPSISRFSNILKKSLKQKAKPKTTQNGGRAQLPAGVHPALKHQVHRMPQAPAKPSFKVQGPPNVTAKPPYK